MKQLIVGLLGAALLGGCMAPMPVVPDQPNVTPSTPTNNAEAYFLANRDLLAAETKWRQNKPRSYSYTLQRSCFCMPEFLKPIQIEILGNTVTRATVEGVPLPLERRANALTVEGLFEIIREAIDDKAHRIDVQYDAEYGFPRSISIDRNAMMADEEVYYTATEFKPKGAATKTSNKRAAKKVKLLKASKKR